MSDTTIDPIRAQAIWAGIAAEIDAPQPSRAERLVLRVGVPARYARLAGATPALRRSWFVATAIALFLGLAMTDIERPRDSLFGLLFLAPLVPVMGVAMAYGPDSDPSHETTLATPRSGLRLLLLRTAVVMGISTAVLVFVSLLAPTSPLVFAWLLPSLASTGATLVAMTFTTPRRAAITIALAWTVIVFGAWAVTADRIGAFTAPGQLVAIGAAVTAVPFVLSRRDHFARLDTAS